MTAGDVGGGLDAVRSPEYRQVLNEGGLHLLQVVVPVDFSADLSDELMECYRVCTLDGTPNAGVSMDAFFRIDTSNYVLNIVVNARAPGRFSFAIQFDLWDGSGRSLCESLLETWEAGCSVALAIYPTWNELDRSARALTGEDTPAFMARGIFVEAKMNCRILRRVRDLIPLTPSLRDPVNGMPFGTDDERAAFAWWWHEVENKLWDEGRTFLSSSDVSHVLSQEARAAQVFSFEGRRVVTTLAELGSLLHRPPAWVRREIQRDLARGILTQRDNVYAIAQCAGQIARALLEPERFSTLPY